jgi:hypothetical protein
MSRVFPLSARAHEVLGNRNIVLTWAWLIGLVVLLSVALVTLRMIVQLDQVSSELVHVSASLDTLNAMNRKLDKLDGMGETLTHMNSQLEVANRSLTIANSRLEAMSGDSHYASDSLKQMTGSLAQMEADLHLMSRKISGSFLFRSVK